ncbi:hypothetical protein NPX13_g3940 [Xylaria arbuscula]|uniref:Uncharacterized protein n=1 Tax=Xylaria arbuscula TaxID=114810 RepID=A0A9W8TNT9_9PEZI|nr:hypothetical protein NPX13_g3940 [Xylaria arbuscula]
MQAKIGCFPSRNGDPREFLRAVEESVKGKDKESLTIIQSDISACSVVMKKSMNYSTAAAHREVTRRRLESAERSRNDAEASYNNAYYKNLETEAIQKEALKVYKESIQTVSDHCNAAITDSGSGLHSARDASDTATEAGVNALRSIQNVKGVLPDVESFEKACEELSKAEEKAKAARSFRPRIPAHPIDAIPGFATVDTKIEKVAEAVIMAKEAERIADEASTLARDVAKTAKAALNKSKECMDKFIGTDDGKKTTYKAQQEAIVREVRACISIESRANEAIQAKEGATRDLTTAQDRDRDVRKARREMNEAAEAIKNADTEAVGFSNSKRKFEQFEKELQDADENHNAAVEAVDTAALALESENSTGTDSARNTSDNIGVICFGRNTLAKNNDEARRKVFLAHLKDDAIIWYDSLPSHIKEDWPSLKSEFLRHFRRN